MLVDKLKQDVRLLEGLSIFGGLDKGSAVLGTPEHLCLSVLRSLHSGELGVAKQQFQELAGALGLPPDSNQLEPLRTILHLKLWDGSEGDKQQLQRFLIKQLGLNFEVEPHVQTPSSSAAAMSPDAAAAGGILAQAPDMPALPSIINQDQYSTTAFLQLMNPNNLPHTGLLLPHYDPSQLLEAIANDSIPVQQRVELLQMGRVPPAVLPVDVLVNLVQQWLDHDSKMTWTCKDAFNWVTSSWDLLTAEQAGCLRAILPGPAFGGDPSVDRSYIAALSKKALAGPSAAIDSSSSSRPAPWACGAAAAAAATDLQRILKVCDQLGAAADWVRILALHAQLHLQQKHQPAVDMSLFISYMKMLGRSTWSPGPTVTDNRFGTQQQQQPMHVACSVCGTRPIMGPRFRSLSEFGFNSCLACVGSQQAVAAGPLEEVKVDDSIYMSPEVSLPPVLGSIPRSEPQRQQEARKMLLELVQRDGAVGEPQHFTLDGPCPLAAAGLLLPKPWRDNVVAEAKLLSGRGDTAPWSRLYQDSGGDVEQLRGTVELAFAAHNRESYALHEDVMLQLVTKNTGHQRVLVKLYEINCWNYYTSEGAEVDLNLELSGLAPSKTIHIDTPTNPVMRCLHSIPLGLPGVGGVWLVEVVAGGIRARARICKGSLHITQRPSVAGQVITVMDECWRPVKGVRLWCDNQEYINKPGIPHEVLLPYARDTRTTPLTIAATLIDQSAAVTTAAEEIEADPAEAVSAAQGHDRANKCVVLFPNFERLEEQYSLRGQLYCHQETLLPGQAVPLLLQLALQLHGQSAPLQLLQEVTLRVTASTHDGAEVTQVFKDLSVDNATGELHLQYNLPPSARRLGAALTAKILLTLPAVNGEPEHQEFELQQLLPGLSGPVASVDIDASAAGSAIWDVYLSAHATPTTSRSTSSGEPEYTLEVLGRAGEAPAAAKVLSVWLSHVHYSPHLKLHVRVQTAADGTVNLGPLTGIRQIEAQLEGGVDCVEPPAAAAGGQAYGGAAGAGAEGPRGVLRQWQIARASWWQGGLQALYILPAGGEVAIPLTEATGQELDAKLLQLVEPAKSGGCSGSRDNLAVTAEITSQHMSLIPATAAAGISPSTSLLGSSSTMVLRVKGLAPGLYRLLVPALLSEPPDEGYVGPGWRGAASSGSRAMALHIQVLPAVEVTAVNEEPAADVEVAAEPVVDGPAAPAGAADCPSWLWVGGEGVTDTSADSEVVQPSPAAQLHVTSCSCSGDSGLSVLLTGTPEQLQSAQVIAVLHRFLPGGHGYAADMLHNSQPWGADSSVDASTGFGFNESLARQSAEGLGSGFAQQPQPCGGLRPCAYSTAARLDSAVAYVLQRRQWEEDTRRGGGLRPGSLLERPSLLVVPRCVRSAASATSVLRGGDGERVREVPLQKQMKRLACSRPPQALECGIAFGAAPWSSRGLQPQACMMNQMQDYCMNRPKTPVLSHLQHPAVVLTDLKVDTQGLLHIPPQQLQRSLSAATAAAQSAPPGSKVGAGISDYSCVYVSAYVPHQPGQFSSARCVVQHAAADEQLVKQVGCRELGLMRDVQEDHILALTCEVLALPPGAAITLPSDSSAAEAALYSSTRQLYQLLAGLLELSEASWGVSGTWPGSGKYNRFGSTAAAGGGSTGALGCGVVSDFGAVRNLLPCPCSPPQAEGATPSMLLRQWEPLLLSWPQLSGSARLELLDKINSAELAFYLSCRHPAAYQQLILPLLKSKLPSELCCLEQILLLQAAHEQPPVPAPGTASATQHPVYSSAKQQVLQHWYAPHRYRHLTALERVLLAALEGCGALLVLCKDMRSSLETPEQKRGVRKTWMSPARRALFEFALLTYKQMEQQQLQEQQQQQRARGTADDDDGDGHVEGATEAVESDDFEHVDFDDLMQQPQLGGLSTTAAPVPPPPAPAPGAAAPQPPMSMAAAPMMMMMRESARAAADELDLSARHAVAAAAARSARMAPKETKEWCEAGWWKWNGQQAVPDIIPVSHFWADFAEHLATNPGQPFIPTDPTGAAASTAAVVAALAVVGLQLDASSTAAGAASGSTGGSSKTLDGPNVTVTAVSPCLIWVKQAKSTASITAAAAATSTGRSAGQKSSRPGPGGTVVVLGGAASVLVSERLYDPRFASTTDPETGEELLLALQPTEQQPLLAGQSYCQSVVITSTGAAEQQLEILVQIPQGAMPLSDQPCTHTTSITLAPHATHTLDMTFYFPLPGVYKRAAASITKRGRPAWLPATPPSPVCVVAGPTPNAPPDSQHDQQLRKQFNWLEFMRTANTQQMLEYLKTGDLSVAQLGDLSPYCRDRTFFSAAVAALTSRHVYSDQIWKWAVAHMDGPALQQLLPMSSLAANTFGRQIPAAHLPLMPLDHRDLGVQHLEYWPWSNPYCRPIPRDDGGDSRLPSVLADNPSIADQWKTFLLATLFDFSGTSTSSSQRGNALSLARAAAAAGYLLLQDRVDDAEVLLRSFDLEAAAAALHEGAPLRMQVDYLRAWMALCRPLPPAADIAAHIQAALALGNSVVECYQDCPSLVWRKRFSQLRSLVKELGQQTTGPAVTAAAAAAAHGQEGESSPEDEAVVLSIISCESGQLCIQCRGLVEIQLAAYQIDTELLFTTQPFSSFSDSSSSRAGVHPATNNTSHAGLGKVAFVQPKARLKLPLPQQPPDANTQKPSDPLATATSAALAMPGPAVFDLDELLPELQSHSVLFEVSGGGISRTVTRFASKLVVHVIENQGILQACWKSPRVDGTSGSSHQALHPAAAVYVKVFAQDRLGDEWFYKDGYTDLRGKFDYVTLTSTADMSRVSRFSLLVASQEFGAVMQQAAPPPR